MLVGLVHCEIFLLLMLCVLAEVLSLEDRAILRLFALKVQSHMNLKTFEKLPFAFPEVEVPTWKTVSARAAFLAGTKPVLFDCCVNSCCCYVGPNADLTDCPFCRSPRYNADQKARKKFTYVPLIPRLVALFRNPDIVQSMQYRAGPGPNNHQHTPGMTSDIFDGEHYRKLLETPVSINGRERSYRFFSDPRDIALGLSTDGFAPFRRRKSTAWPLLIFNFNLPPEIRFHIKYSLCLGVIPGPKKPKDYDSFSFPAIEELLTLAIGVRAYDILSRSLFRLRAYLILIFGDIPAMSMVMSLKGHNGLRPCRMCNIKGLRVPDSRATTHYIPLKSPSVRGSTTTSYDPANLPLRTHEEILRQGREVDSSLTKAEANHLSQKYGVKGVSAISYIPGIQLPISCPYDFMHLIWENVVKNLILLWTGEFKGIDEGTGSYHLAPAVWEAIGMATAASGSTIPSAFGARPPNVENNKMACSAESWSFWTLYLGPVLLAHKFQNSKYYKHFVDLVKLLHICLQFNISDDEIETLRTGFIAWVESYEA